MKILIGILIFLLFLLFYGIDILRRYMVNYYDKKLKDMNEGNIGD